MLITIYEGYSTDYVLLGSNETFHAEYGDLVRIPTNNLYKELAQITSWVKNELEDECLFEVV